MPQIRALARNSALLLQYPEASVKCHNQPRLSDSSAVTPYDMIDGSHSELPSTCSQTLGEHLAESARHPCACALPPEGVWSRKRAQQTDQTLVGLASTGVSLFFMLKSPTRTRQPTPKVHSTGGLQSARDVLLDPRRRTGTGGPGTERIIPHVAWPCSCDTQGSPDPRPDLCHRLHPMLFCRAPAHSSHIHAGQAGLALHFSISLAVHFFTSVFFISLLPAAWTLFSALLCLTSIPTYLPRANDFLKLSYTTRATYPPHSVETIRKDRPLHSQTCCSCRSLNLHLYKEPVHIRGRRAVKLFHAWKDDWCTFP